MDSDNEQPDGQAGTIPRILECRIGRDDSLWMTVAGEQNLQVSEKQADLLVALHGAGGWLPLTGLKAIAFRAVGAASASNRASLSRIVRRLAERSLAISANRTLALTPRGETVARFIGDFRRRIAEARAAKLARVNTPTIPPTLLTSAGCEGAA